MDDIGDRTPAHDTGQGGGGWTLPDRLGGFSRLKAASETVITGADFFKLPPDGSVLMCEITRTALDGNGQSIRLIVTVYPWTGTTSSRT
jgi:hypothetical protein